MIKQKHFLMTALCACIIQTSLSAMTAAKQRVAEKAALVVTGGALYYGYKNWFAVPDTTMPTLETMNVKTFMPIAPGEIVYASQVLVEKSAIKKALNRPKGGEIININGQYFRVHLGIPDSLRKNNPFVTILSGGCYDNAYTAYVMMKAGNINGPCISFDYPTTTRRAFNFCQKQDIECLNLLYRAVTENNPDIRVLFYGACKGGTNILRYLAETTEAKSSDSVKQVSAVSIESPTISVYKAIGQYPLVHLMATLIFPNYDSTKKTIMEAVRMPQHVPIFIGRLTGDTVSKFQDNSYLAYRLSALGCQTYLMTTQESSIIHGQLGRAKDYKAALAAFFMRYSLPFCKENKTPIELSSLEVSRVT